MKQLLAIILIAVIACTTTEEEKKNPIETIKEDVTEKAKEIAEKAKKIAEEIAGKAKKMAQEIAEKAKEMGDESSEKAKEIAEEVAAKAKDIAKDFMKFFEKLSEEVKMAIVWLKDNGYWDDLVNLAETIGKAAAVQACKTYITQPDVSCDKIVQFVFDAVIALLKRIKGDEKTE